MTRLALALLGPFQAALDGEPITSLKSNKERALLAYLTVEARRPHYRNRLAGLLWPESPNRTALGNLRSTLSNLRHAIDDHAADPPFLLITRSTIQFNTASDYQLDVDDFVAKSQSSEPETASWSTTIHDLHDAVALYRGDFLQDLSLRNSAAFEEWALFKREEMERQVLIALERLAAMHEQQGEYRQAQVYAHRQLEFAPWDETVHRQLMRLLALDGQRSAALVQYETCRRLLAEELGVEPGQKTTTLYEHIRDEKLKGLTPTVDRFLPPLFLNEERPVRVKGSVFVAREHELTRLETYLDRAMAGEGQVAFVTGSAGQGKTTLIQEFSRRASEAHPNLLVAGGNAAAYAGIGDPYLPFREALALLTGDVETQLAAGTLAQTHAHRLWRSLPVAMTALVEMGPDLIGSFLPRAALLKRAKAYPSQKTGWIAQLEELVERPVAISSGVDTQSALFEQYTRVLWTLAHKHPLLLVLDDLQWADPGSVGLLFHLGRELAGRRILIVGAYRSEEIAAGRDGARHPLESLVNECQRTFGEIEIDLNMVEERQFVEALLDVDPNQLGPAFRETLYHQTRGHPLFTVELLREMQARGDLVQDEKGWWVEGTMLDWEKIPARVEAVIAERIDRLDAASREILRLASIEGETFTAQVIAQVQATDVQQMVNHLSRVLARDHHLVQAQGVWRIDGQRLSQYRFRHILFQKYLYNSLDPVERAHLHEQVGITWETLCGENGEEFESLAPQLAWHFQEAGVIEKAVDYLHQAGQRAIQVLAYEDAQVFFERGLALIETVPKAANKTQRDEQIRRKIRLLRGINAAEFLLKGFGTLKRLQAWERMHELSLQLGDPQEIFVSLSGLTVMHSFRGNHQELLELMKQLLKLAELAQHPVGLTLTYALLGSLWVSLGELVTARKYLEQGRDLYAQSQHLFLDMSYTSNTEAYCLTWLAPVLWCLGYPDQAVACGQKAWALGEKEKRIQYMELALTIGGTYLHLLRQEEGKSSQQVETLLRLASEARDKGYRVWGTILQGSVQAEQGRVEEGIALIHQGITAWKEMGVRLGLTCHLTFLAMAYARAGQWEEGVRVLDEALVEVERGERILEAEIYRLKGQFLWNAKSQTSLFSKVHLREIEDWFQRAVNVARRQQVKSFELRAVINLCRLWQTQGKVSEAQKMLTVIYDWFSEGFDTGDLKEARALLQELAQDREPYIG